MTGRLATWFDNWTPRRYRKGGPNNYRRARFILSLCGMGYAGAMIFALLFGVVVRFPAGTALCLGGAAMYAAIP